LGAESLQPKIADARAPSSGPRLAEKVEVGWAKSTTVRKNRGEICGCDAKPRSQRGEIS
jgi:hypothetical protein